MRNRRTGGGANICGNITSTLSGTASLAQWLRRPSREREARGSIPTFAVGFFFPRVEPYLWFKNTPVATLLGAWRCKGQRWDWLARCQYTVTGWDRKFGLYFLSRCGSTSEQIRVWDTLACCEDRQKQPTLFRLTLLRPLSFVVCAAWRNRRKTSLLWRLSPNHRSDNTLLTSNRG